MILLYCVIGLIGLGLMVFIHELGHFLAARAVGIDVEAFAIGWGPTLFHKQGKTTEYRLAAFPIGGYCKMKGEQDMVDALQNKTDHMTPSPGSFFAAAPWKRMIVSFAGPFVNLLFAILVMGLIWWIGYSYSSPDNRIVMLTDYADSAQNSSDKTSLALFSANSPAAVAGLITGDRIIAVNGKPSANFREFSYLIGTAAKQKLTLAIERDGQRFEVFLTPLMDPATGGGKIGIYPWVDAIVEKAQGSASAAGLQPGDRILKVGNRSIKQSIDINTALQSQRDNVPIIVLRNQKEITLTFVPDPNGKGAGFDCTFNYSSYHTPAMGPIEAASRGITETIDNLAITVRSLGLLFQGLSPFKALSGPGRIVPMIGEAATQGFSIGIGEGFRSFFHFLAFISIALFFGNLLPIPALDGGQILLFIGEAIRRKPLNPQFVQRYQIIGALMVFCLLGMAIFGDVLFWTGL